MAQDWDRMLDRAAGYLLRVIRETDPDVVADTLTRYWYTVQHRGVKPGPLAIRWAWLTARTGRVLPFETFGHGYGDAHKQAKGKIKDIDRCRKNRNPAYLASVREEVSLVWQEASNRSERVAVQAFLLSQEDQEAAQEHGTTATAIRVARHKLFTRCRARRRAQR